MAGSLLFKTPAARANDSAGDELIARENQWLAGTHDRAVLDDILAPDFLHPLGNGVFATKAQHIKYATTHLPPPNLHQRFEQMKVRIYGNIGIVNGIVVTSDQHGRDVERTVFTDVFLAREGRWRAINAQENKVQKPVP